MASKSQMAAALINTKTLPACLDQVRRRAYEARAYDILEPYPLFHFQDWKIEDRGPRPRCLPIAKSIVSRGARWLFGKPLQLHAPENPRLEEFVRAMWRKNRMSARLVAMARNGAIEGGIALKFAYDETAQVPLSIQALSLADECRLYYNPHDCNELLMARVQYSYLDAATGKLMWYREEWTAEQEVHYFPVPDEQFTLSRGITNVAMGYQRTNPDTYEGWRIDPAASNANPFGLIPVTHIKNLETDDLFGAGDLWDLYRVLDRIHLTYHLMDRSNQFDAETNPIYIDLELDEHDIDKPLVPGQPIDAKSVEGERQGKVEFPPTGNALRPAMMEYARELTKQIRSAASSVEVDQSEFSNKGNLTSAVLEQLFQPLIEITIEKRKSYGDNGIVAFLQLVALGVQALGVDLGVNAKDEDSYDIQIQWPSFFDLSQDELTALTARTQEEVIAGFLTQERAVERIAQANGIQDVTALQEELAKQPRPSPTETDPNAQNAIDQTGKLISTIDREGGKDSL